MAEASLRTITQLASRGLVDPENRSQLERVAARYAVTISSELANSIDITSSEDPIARQFVPDTRELDSTAGEDGDPIGDDAHSPVQGIVHRYPDRVLLKIVSVCAVYCRFCFRREMVGPSQSKAMSKAALDAALDYIRRHREIWEVILTGGDPLVLSPRRLRAVMKALSEIEHVKVVRFHTRVPVADPARVTAELAHAMKADGKATYVAIHVNHARELTPHAREACSRMADAGMPLLAQTVLLAGVNDDENTLGELMRALVECRIKPYYLHHPDMAPGTSHFRKDLRHGQQLMRNLRGRWSGLCQPTYVLDIPGGHGKSPVGPSYLESIGDGSRYRVEDFDGDKHLYPPA